MIEITAHAIVSADDRIADETGRFPTALINEADWNAFQAELDRCDITVLGRRSHIATPNVKQRKRVIMTSGGSGLEPNEDGWWWNPRLRPWEDIARELLPSGGRVGVPGGQGAFDYFLDHGMTAFHMSRAWRATLPQGRGVFSAVERGERSDEILRGRGFQIASTRMIDAAAEVELTIWRREVVG